MRVRPELERCACVRPGFPMIAAGRERCAAAGTQERCACGTAWCSTARGGRGGGGEDVRAVAAAAVGEMRPLPSPVQMDLDYPIFFHPIESNPNGSKAMDIHIQLDPNPIELGSCPCVATDSKNILL